MITLVFAPTYARAAFGAEQAGLERRDWTFVNRPAQLMGLQPPIATLFVVGYDEHPHWREMARQLQIIESRKDTA